MAKAMHSEEDPQLTIPSSGTYIPQLAFGLYKVPADEEGESIILEAIKVREQRDTRVPHRVTLRHQC